MKWLRNIAMLVLAALIAGLAFIKLSYGGGKPFPSVATEPMRADLEAPIETDYPPGMVAAGPDGRLFYTYHPLHKPELYSEHVIFEWTDGASRPVSIETPERLHGTFGITIDQRGWLWGVRPAGFDREQTDVFAIDPDTGEIKFEYFFPKGQAGVAQDLRVSSDGRYVFLADTGLLTFTSANLIILDTEAQTHRIVLDNHPSVAPQDWVLRKTNGKPYRLAMGLITFKVGVDGLELTPDGKWLIYAAMSHDGVYRVPVSLLTDFDATDEAISAAVEYVGPAPMSDGIALDAEGNVILTDVENGSLALLADGELKTLAADERIDWSDSVTVAPNGDIWFTDSRLTALIDQFAQPSSGDDMLAQGRYRIYRLPGNEE